MGYGMLLMVLALAPPSVWLNGRLLDGAGQPLPGQTVRLVALDSPDTAFEVKWPLDLWHQVLSDQTDNEGLFRRRLDRGDGPHLLAAEVGAEAVWLRFDPRVVPVSERTDRRLELDLGDVRLRPDRVVGAVLEPDGQRAVGDLWVTMWPKDLPPMTQALLLDRDFELRGLPPEQSVRVTLTAGDPRLPPHRAYVGGPLVPSAPVLAELAEVRPSADLGARIALTVPRRRLTGKLVDGQGNAVRGGLLSLGAATATSDAQGGFAFDGLLPGTRMLSVPEPGYGLLGGHCLRTVPIEISRDKDPEPLVVEQSEPVMALHLLSHDGRPLPPTTAAVLGTDDWWRWPVGEQGVCRVSLAQLPGAFRAGLLIRHHGYAVVEWGRRDTLPTSASQTVRLAEGGTVTGRVVDGATGRPLGGVLALPMRRPPAGAHTEWDRFWATFVPSAPCIMPTMPDGFPLGEVSSDADGRFRIENLPPGDYRLSLSVGFDVPRRPGPVFTIDHDGLTVDLGDIRMDLDTDVRQIRGRLLTASGQPVRSRAVTVVMVLESPNSTLRGEMRRAALTDADGRFTLWPEDGLAARLRAYLPEEPDRATPWEPLTAAARAGVLTLRLPDGEPGR